MADDLILRFHYVDHRPRFTLRGIQVWPNWGFQRSGEAERIKGKTWRISRRLADELYVDALRRSIIGHIKQPGVWWGVGDEYNEFY